jgi:hypothetical protein
MKKNINFILLSILFVSTISSNINSFKSQRMTSICLANILPGDDGPKFTVKYSNVTCVYTTSTGADGSQIGNHDVTCYGVGSLECKCPGHIL